MILFKETQQFKRWWIWIGLTAINGIFVYAIIQQLFFHKPFGNTPVSDTNLLLLSFIPLSLLVFVFSIKLETSISDDGICYRFYPFQFNTTWVEWEDLADAHLREFNALYEYGGWGIRVGNSKNNRAVTTSTSGNIGLQLEFKNGSRLLIGTTKPKEIKQVLNKLKEQGKIGWKV